MHRRLGNDPGGWSLQRPGNADIPSHLKIVRYSNKMMISTEGGSDWVAGQGAAVETRKAVRYCVRIIFNRLCRSLTTVSTI